MDLIINSKTKRTAVDNNKLLIRYDLQIPTK